MWLPFLSWMLSEVQSRELISQASLVEVRYISLIHLLGSIEGTKWVPNLHILFVQTVMLHFPISGVQQQTASTSTQKEET